MLVEYFNPFEEMIFDENFCFLTGKLTTESVSIFPEWLLEHFKIGDDYLELMDKSKSIRYKDLKMPCTAEVKSAFEKLENKVQNSYKNGYEGMKSLPEEQIFQWVGKMLYGMVYTEMLHEWKRRQKLGREFKISPDLKERFGTFHFMLQSIVEPIEFKGRKPWSLVIFPLKYSEDIFSYRDDMINLLFTMGVDKFGLIMHMQDNGAIAEKESDLLSKMKGYILHPVQYEELYAKFHYSDYILQYKPKYNIERSENGITIEALPMVADEGRPLFGFWDEHTYAQLLSNYWQVYGIEVNDIRQFQKPMLSYLQNPYTLDFINPETIDLPF